MKMVMKTVAGAAMITINHDTHLQPNDSFATVKAPTIGPSTVPTMTQAYESFVD